MEAGKIDRINELYHKSQSVGKGGAGKAEKGIYRSDPWKPEK